jgi:hypothetical protein
MASSGGSWFSKTMAGNLTGNCREIPCGKIPSLREDSFIGGAYEAAGKPN